MRRVALCLVGLAIASPMLFGQATPSGATTPGTSPIKTAPKMPSRGAPGAAKGARYKPDVTVNTPIVTIDGVCATPEKASTKGPAAACKTVITRGQLDAMLEAYEPDASPKARQQFALNYARLLAASQLAEERNLDKNPDVVREIQVQQKLARLQVLSNRLVQSLGTEAQHIPQKDLEAYYTKYASMFEGADVQRIVIPLSAVTESGKPIDQAAAKAKMEDIRSKIVEGGDFNELQAQAYQEFTIKGPLPATNINLMRRGGLTPDEAKVFDMDLGATTPVFENQGVLMLLRVVSRRTLPLSEAKSQIEAVVLQQRLVESLKDATKGITAEFNLKYMESPSQPELFPPSVLTLGTLRRGLMANPHVQP